MKELKTISDEKLLRQIQSGNDDAMECLLERYRDMVRKEARSFFLAGGDEEDLIQEGMIGLFKAVRDYDTGRDASFFTFADLCVSRQMYTAIQAAGRQKHMPLNTYVSLYADGADGEDGLREAERGLLESAASRLEQNPEELLIDRENVKRLEEVMEKELSSFEKQVLDLYLTGMKYSQIARVLGKDDKSTDNALQRIKAKLKRAISSKEQL